MKARRYRICVRNYYNNENKWVNVYGYPAKMPYIEGTFVFKSDKDKLWRVTEPVTGDMIGEASTSKKLAVKYARDTVNEGIKKYIHSRIFKSLFNSGRVKIVNAGKEFKCDEKDILV